MIMTIYKRALGVLLSKPLKLWGISLLSIALSSVLGSLCGVAIPGLSLAVGMLIGTSMTMIYLAGYRGQKVEVAQLFSCFKDWSTIKRVLCGTAWMYLWIFLWSLIPFVGFIFAIVRSYQYRLTPYILVTEPDVSITDAIKVSAERTSGYKLKMWLADFLIDLIFGLGCIVIGLLAAIPFIGILFGIVLFLLIVVYTVLRPLFSGLVQAAFYEEITHPTMPKTPVMPQYQAPQQNYQAPQYQAPQQNYQAPQYQAPQYQAPQYQQPQYQEPQSQQPPCDQ